MNIYEQYGRLVERYEIECEAHRQTVGVLRALKQGDLLLDALTVTDENKWSIAAEPSIAPSTSDEQSALN